MTTTNNDERQPASAPAPAEDETASFSVFSRRNVLAVGALGAAGVALAACSSGASDSKTSTSPTASGSGTPSGSASASGGSGGGAQITSLAKVPVGGAVITRTQDTAFVVSQQKAGQVACYSAVCPHQGCLCSTIQGEEAVCPCHGSRFNVFSGDVTQGPATTGLTKVDVTVSGGKVVQS